MGRRLPEKPQDYTGPREVIRGKTMCGWCNDGFHESCKHETAYYEKLWVCSCKCNDSWVPQDVGTTEPEIKRKRGKDDLRDVQLPTEAGKYTDATDAPGELRQPVEPGAGGGNSLETEPTSGNTDTEEQREDPALQSQVA